MNPVRGPVYRQQVIERVESLLQQGRTPAQIRDELGYGHSQALRRLMRKAGRPDLSSALLDRTPRPTSSSERMRQYDDAIAIGMTSPAEILRTMGVTAEALTRAAYRAGRRDVVRKFQREVWHERRSRELAA